jgi:hypothetical protein
MENLCMRFLVVSFLRWGVTSCVMWALPICQCTPLFAANCPRVVPLAAVDHLVLRAPLDRRAQAVLQARRVPVAPLDRAVAVVHQALDHRVDPEAAEAKDPPAKAAAREPVGLQDPAGALVVREAQAAAAHQVRVVLRVALARLEAQVHLDQVADPLAPHREAAVRAVVDPVVLGVDQVVNPVLVLNRARGLAPKAAVSHQDLDHRALVVAALVALDPVDPTREVNPRVAVTAADQVQVAQHLDQDQGVVREPVALDREAVVMVLRAVAPPVHRAVVVARVSTCGTVQDGRRWTLSIRVHHPLALSKFSVVALETSQPVPVLTLDKQSTQDVNKVPYE